MKRGHVMSPKFHLVVFVLDINQENSDARGVPDSLV